MAIATLIFLLHSPSVAQASSAKCVRIERQLASLDTGIGRDPSGYGAAIRQQKRQIARTQQRMRSYQCTRSGHPNCARLGATLDRMIDNLESLEQRYYGTASGSRNVERKRRRLERSYRRYKCDRRQQRVASLERPNFLQRLLNLGNTRKTREEVRKNSGDILDEVFGSPQYADRRRQARLDRRDRLRRELDRQLWSSANGLASSNKYRTICVRRCDGYYFPVSHETDESGFAQDAMACNLMCPGTQMELFSHRAAGETPEQMVSTVDGTLYTSLRKAFSHREKFDPQCACNFKLVKRSYNIDIPDSVRLARLTNQFFKEKKTALPSWRRDQPGLNEGDSKKQKIISQAASDISPDLHDPRRETSLKELEERRKRPIRVIGDAFFPNQ